MQTMKTLIYGMAVLLVSSISGIAQAGTPEPMSQAGTVAAITEAGSAAAMAPSPSTLLIFGAGVVTLMLIAMRQGE